MTHDDIRSLLGAYALNATTPLEVKRVEAHLSDCDDCSREVRMLTETAAQLGVLAEAQATPPDLVDRIVASVPPRRSQHRGYVQVAASIAAVAIVVAGAFGVLYDRQRSENARLTEIVASTQRVAQLQATGDFQGHGVVHIADGSAAVVLEDMPEPGPARSYQLWALSAQGPVSMSVLDGTDRIVAIFEWTGAGDTFAVTVEPEGGSEAPTTDPILISS